jgi:hypothetical protein
MPLPSLASPCSSFICITVLCLGLLLLLLCSTRRCLDTLLAAADAAEAHTLVGPASLTILPLTPLLCCCGRPARA